MLILALIQFQVAFVHGIVMGGGGVLVVPSTFSVVTEKAVCVMSYMNI